MDESVEGRVTRWLFHVKINKISTFDDRPLCWCCPGVNRKTGRKRNMHRNKKRTEKETECESRDQLQIPSPAGRTNNAKNDCAARKEEVGGCVRDVFRESDCIPNV